MVASAGMVLTIGKKEQSIQVIGMMVSFMALALMNTLMVQNLKEISSMEKWMEKERLMAQEATNFNLEFGWMMRLYSKTK